MAAESCLKLKREKAQTVGLLEENNMTILRKRKLCGKMETAKMIKERMERDKRRTEDALEPKFFEEKAIVITECECGRHEDEVPIGEHIADSFTCSRCRQAAFVSFRDPEKKYTAEELADKLLIAPFMDGGKEQITPHKAKECSDKAGGLQTIDDVIELRKLEPYGRPVKAKKSEINHDWPIQPKDRGPVRRDSGRPIKENVMGFDEALKSLKAGHRVSRTSWNDRSISLMPARPIEDDKYLLRPFFYEKMTNASQLIVWLPTAEDLLADDWMAEL